MLHINGSLHPSPAIPQNPDLIIRQIILVLQLWTFRESVLSPKGLIFLRQHMVSGLRKSWVPSLDPSLAPKSDLILYICTTQNCIDI